MPVSRTGGGPGSAPSLGPSDSLLGQIGQAIIDENKALFGFERSTQTRRFQQEYPILGTATSLASPLGAYYGWLKATTKIPKLAKTLDRIGDMKRAPIRTTALRETARFAPFELGRVGVAAAFGDPSMLTETARGAAANLALAGAIGGGIGALRRAASDNVIASRIIPDFDAGAPPTLQLRRVQETLGRNELKIQDADAFIEARRLENSMRQRVVLEDVHRTPAGTQRSGRGTYAQPLTGATSEGNRSLNRLFVAGETAPKGPKGSGKEFRKSRKNIESRKFVVSPETGFDSRRAVNAALAEAGLENQLAYVRYPRHLRAKTGKSANNLERAIQAGLTSGIGRGQRFGREANEGLYVVAKKTKGDLARPAGGDEWVVFKTDSPERFFPQQHVFGDGVVKRSAWLERLHPEDKAKESGIEVLQGVKDALGRMPFFEFKDFIGPGGRTKRAADMLNRRLAGGTLSGASAKQALRDAGDFARQYIYPSMFQFNKSPRAQYLFNMMRMSVDMADGITQQAFRGIDRIDPKLRSVMAQQFGGIRPSGRYLGGRAVEPMIDELSERQFSQLMLAKSLGWDRTALKEAYASGAVDRKVLDTLDRLMTIDEHRWKQYVDIQDITGSSGDRPISREMWQAQTWIGKHRVPVVNADGQQVFVASGRSARDAQREADFIVERGNASGFEWKTGANTRVDGARQTDTQMVGMINGTRAEALNARTARKEFLEREYPDWARAMREGGEVSAASGPWTKAELKESLLAQMTAQNRYIADLSTRELFSREMQALAEESPAMAKALDERRMSLFGEQGDFSRMQNQVADRILGRVLGPNSASTVVRALNTTMMNWQLGAGNLQFPILNAFTFMQTTLPQLSFVMKAPRGSLEKYYSWLPAVGSDGLPRGTIGYANPLKLLWQSAREMRSPDQTLLQNLARAAQDRVTDPRLVEEYIGENAANLKDLRGALTGKQPFSQWLRAASEFLPGSSEKLARAHSFVTGHIVGRDVLKMEGDQLYNFAREFTNNTMFLYGAVDRPRLINGPIGSLFGMFKNWQAHYIGWMLEYTGQGVVHGNWAPLMWMLGGTATVGGVAAVPAWGVADAFSRWSTGKTGMEHVYNMMGGAEMGLGGATMADAVFMGVPAFMGVSMQSSASVPGSDPARDAGMLMSFVHMNRARALGRAVGNAIDAYSITGEHPINDAATRDSFIQALAPRTFYRLNQVVHGDFIRSARNQNPQITDLTPIERYMVFAGLGMNPISVQKEYEVARILYEDQVKRSAAIRDHGSRYFQAIEGRDHGTAQTVLMSAMYKGILDETMRSYAARLGQADQGTIERRNAPEDIQRFRQILNR